MVTATIGMMVHNDMIRYDVSPLAGQSAMVQLRFKLQAEGSKHGGRERNRNRTMSRFGQTVFWWPLLSK